MLDELFKEITELKDYKHTLKELLNYHLLEIGKYYGDQREAYYYLISKSSDKKYWISRHIGEYLMENKE